MTNIKSLIHNKDKPNDLGKKIAKILKEKGISESKIAKDLGLPYNTIKRLINGETSDPRYSTLCLITEYLSMTIEELKENSVANPVTVPLLAWDKVIKYINKDILITPDNWHDWIQISSSTADKINATSFALKSLPSMQPRFTDNTVFIIDPKANPIDGDIVLVEFIKTQEISLKDLTIDPPRWIFKSLSDHSSFIEKNSSQHKIIGVVFYTLTYNR